MLGRLFLHSTLPVLEVCCLGLFGVVLARKGVLSSEARRALSVLVFYLFIPAFIFIKLASSINLERLVQWWPVVLNMALSIAMGLGFGKLMAYITCATDAQRPILIAAAGLGNAGNMPLVLLSAVVREGGFRVTRQEGDRGTAYVVLGMMVASLTHYTLGSHLLRRKDGLQRLDSGPAIGDNGSQDGATMPVRKSGNQYMMLQSLRSARAREDRALLLPPAPRPLTPSPFPTAHPIGQIDAEDPFILTPPPGPSVLTEQLRRIWARIREVAGPALRDSVSPPTMACVAALFIGIIPPLKNLMFHHHQPLAAVRTALSMYGECAIPSMMLLLGATLHSGPGKGHVPVRHIVGVILCRQVLLPMLGTAVVVLCLKGGFFSCQDPLFLLVLFLQHTVPTAVNLHTLAAVHQNGEQELGVLLFWQYMVSIVTVPCCLMLYLRLVLRYCPQL